MRLWYISIRYAVILIVGVVFWVNDAAVGDTINVADRVFGFGVLNSNAAVSPDGRYAVGGYSNILVFCDLSNGSTDLIQAHSVYPAGVEGAEIGALAFSPDGDTLLAGDGWGKAMLWDVNKKEVIRTFEGHPPRLRAVAFSSDGKRILTGGSDRAILWDVITGEQILVLTISFSLETVAISPDGQFAIVGGHVYGGGGCAEVRELQTGKPVFTLTEDRTITSAVYSPDGRTILTGSSNSTAKLWDASNGELIRTLKRHEKRVLSVAFSPDGAMAATAGADSTVKLWNIDTGAEIKTFYGNSHGVHSVSFSPDGRKLITGGGAGGGGRENSIKLWDIETGDCELTFCGGNNWQIFSGSFSPDGQHILTSSFGAVLWSAETLEEIHVFNGSTLESAVFSPDGNSVLCNYMYNKEFVLWDIHTYKEIMTFKGHGGETTCAAFSPCGKFLATGSDDGTARLWDVETGAELKVLTSGDKNVRSIAYSPSGMTILAGTIREEGKGRILLWDVREGEIIKEFIEPDCHSKVLTFSPDGKYFLSAGFHGRFTSLWEIETGDIIRSFGIEREGHCSCFSPDGEWVLTTTFNYVLLWDTKTGQLLRMWAGHTFAIVAAGFSPDGNWILTAGGMDGTARLWYAGDLKQTIAATPTPVPTPTPKPMPRTSIGIDLSESALRPGDLMETTVQVRLPPSPDNVDIYIAVEVGGEFFSWPTMLHGVRPIPVAVPAEGIEVPPTEIFSFVIPDIGPLTGSWLAAVTPRGATEILACDAADFSILE